MRRWDLTARPATGRRQVRAAATAVESDYAALCERLREISSLGQISGLLGHDEQVFMPPGAAASRAAQKAALAGVTYEKSVDAELGALIDRLAAKMDRIEDPVQRAVVRDAQVGPHGRAARNPAGVTHTRRAASPP